MGPENKDAGKLPPGLFRKRNLVLIGYRAAGKTEVGALLAEKLGKPFVDLDEALVAAMGQSIADLVAKKGWPDFRRREKEMVIHYSRVGGRVLATGGGVVLDPENVAALRKNGVVVWLQADPGTSHPAPYARDVPPFIGTPTSFFLRPIPPQRVRIVSSDWLR